MRLSNDELWKKAGTDDPITMEDIGLSPKENSAGLTTNIQSLNLHCPSSTLRSWFIGWMINNIFGGIDYDN